MHLAYQHCAFINSDSESFPGSLVHTTETKEKGFLAFLRLVGTAYFSTGLAFHLILLQPSSILLDPAVIQKHSTKNG